ncbi:MAG: hypothetical protein HRT68_03305 [Flavobacteriaceae bacterium]|nr:hypothetical protein [Flavobacteriaceae bacterium]
MKNQIAIFIVSCLFSVLSVQGQDNDFFSSPDSVSRITREIELKDDSKPEEVAIIVGDQDSQLMVQIFSIISKGKLVIELYDPFGTKQGKFSVAAQMSATKKEKVQGSMNKRLRDPKSGDWKIKILPKNVEGSILVEVEVIQ